MSSASNAVMKGGADSPPHAAGSTTPVAGDASTAAHATVDAKVDGTPSSAESLTARRAPRFVSTAPALKAMWRSVGIPLLAIAIFLLVWSRLSSGIETSLGQIPGPMAVVAQTQALWADHLAEREKRAAFYERQKVRNAARLAEDPTATIVERKYTGKPTYIDQIFTSLKTVFAGFLLATLVAVPAEDPVRPVEDGEHRAESVHSAVQTGVAARVAAHRHAAGQRAVHQRKPDVREVLRELGHHGDAVLAVADGDQHRARRRLDRSRPHERRARAEPRRVHSPVQARAAGVAAC